MAEYAQDSSATSGWAGKHPPRIYVSAFWVEVEGHNGFPAIGMELVADFEKSGIDLILHREFREYDQIEKEIDSYQALLALVDIYWNSSTGKLSEVTYAYNGCGVFHVNSSKKPIPVFIYPIDDKSAKFAWPGLIYLGRDIRLATDQICKELKWTRGDVRDRR